MAVTVPWEEGCEQENGAARCGKNRQRGGRKEAEVKQDYAPLSECADRQPYAAKPTVPTPAVARGCDPAFEAFRYQQELYDLS